MLTFDLVNSTTPSQLECLLLAFVLSAIIGVERGRKLKSAGLRTHTLVGLGSAVFTLVSAYGFSTVLGNDTMLDPARIAAQIVSGIGFLGAGVIFVRQDVVTGLTTAASIWVTASIGMACGAGMHLIAVLATALHLITVLFLAVVARKIPTINKDQIIVLRYKERVGVLRAVLSEASQLGFEASLNYTREIERPGKTAVIEAGMRFHSGKRPLADLVEVLSDVRGITEVRLAKDDTE
jgi:putative Mg2+ transporter-C (MgtC) family protein